MESSYFDKIPETELIEKFNSPTTSREESSAILAYLLEKYQAFLADQCRRCFSNSSFINFEDILQQTQKSNRHLPRKFREQQSL
jgi:hypothetical protein